MATDAPAANPPIKVTLLVIAYRMAATIADAVRSALAQSHTCEIIVSDDSSGDDTLAIAQQIVATYAGPHSVRLRSTAENLGLCAHLNELAAISSGDVLVFLGGDDVAYPRRVEQLVAALAADPQAQLVGSAVDDIDAQGKLIAGGVRALPPRVDQRWFLRRGRLQTVLGASMAIRRELLTGMPALQGIVEDNMLSLRAALIGHCLCLPQALLGYRRHADNLGNWVFDRTSDGYAGYERRHRRVLAMYREIAADQEQCAAARDDLPVERRRLALELAHMYRLEAQMREVILDQPRWRWLAPLARGIAHPGLRRKSAERALKLLLPRRWFAR
jgi:glycosyltransferase involved in cell wall biosynthesis